MVKVSAEHTASSGERADDARSGIQVIRRAVGVLRVLAEQGRNGLSLGAIAARVDLPRSTVQRIVGALEEEGMVAPAIEGGGFCLGPTVGELARGIDVDPVEVFRSEMVALHASLDESVALNSLGAGRVQVLDMLSSTKPLRVVLPKVLDIDLLTSAPGKAILAILDEDERAAAIAMALKAKGADRARMKFDRSAFDAELATARLDGHALEQDEPYPDISGLAIALRLGGKPYAITVLLPTGRFDAERALIASALAESLAALRRRLIGEGQKSIG